MANNAYSVHSLSEVKIPWFVRRKVRRAKKKGRTGVLLYGRHRLRFYAGRPKSFSAFNRDVDLESGGVVVAVCEPIQPWSMFRPSPSTDRWYIGVV